MPRGGHGRVGPMGQDAATRKLHGSRTRPHHRAKSGSAPSAGECQRPPGLSRLETAFWNYYAPQLAAERRLTLKARDTLAKYCTALAVVSGLRTALASRKRADMAARAGNRKELRQWLLAARLYENDLLFNPASSIRAPQVDIAPPIAPGARDPFDEEFDDEPVVN